MSFKTFVNKAREHAKVNNGQLYINPIEIIEKMWEKQRGVPVQDQEQELSQKPNNTPSRENTTQRLGRETLHEQNDMALKNKVEQVIAQQQKEIENNRKNNDRGNSKDG